MMEINNDEDSSYSDRKFNTILEKENNFENHNYNL